jgi:hypothetical protein
VIGDQKRIQPRKKSAVERIDAADDEKQQKFSGEEMITDTIEDPHSDNSFKSFITKMKRPISFQTRSFLIRIASPCDRTDTVLLYAAAFSCAPDRCRLQGIWSI